MTRAVQINLKQKTNSALNNKQMVISSKNRITRTRLSATVTQVSNFVEVNVFTFYIVKAPHPDACCHSLSNNRNARSIFKALNIEMFK